MIPAVVSKLDPHKSYGLEGIPAIDLEKRVPDSILTSLNYTTNDLLLVAFQLIGNPILWFQCLRTLANRFNPLTIGLLAFYAT